MNPFSVPNAPAWLIADPAHQLPRLLTRLLEVAEAVPQVYEELPWLRDMNVLCLVQERFSATMFGAAAPGWQETTLTSFFARVTEPIAKLVEALYTAPLLRDRYMVGEILRRMALAAGQEPLAQAVISGVCAGYFHRRVDRLGSEPIRPQAAIWQISWQPTTVQLRSPLGIKSAFVVLVTDQATEKILALRCTTEVPSATAMQLALYDALVFPGAGRWYAPYLVPPTHLRVQAPLPQAIDQAARIWRTQVDETGPQDCPWLRELERELGPRRLDTVRFLRIVDRVCERCYGYAPFLAKQRAVRQWGWHRPADNDPLQCCLGLRELLPAYPARVGDDGTVEWQGWHYRATEQDVLRYFPHAAVTVRPSPLSEALVAVYWNEAILCCAVADELRHRDGSYRPYWFPYPRLGE